MPAFLALAAIVCCNSIDSTQGFSQAYPAGATDAVLSFIDAAAGRVEVVRHWPQAPVDVDLYPFVPYFWDGCPARGAIVFLVTGSPLTGNPFDDRLTIDRVRAITSRLGNAILTAVRDKANDAVELRRLVGRAGVPGDPTFEAAKALVPLISDLATYEHRGYAVFAFVAWQGWRCAVVFRAVPEGYGVPFVR